MKSSLTFQIIILFTLQISVFSRDCYLACDEVQITYDKQLCYQNCDIKLIVPATVGSFFAICFIVIFICCCKYRTYTCLYFIKRRLKKRFNTIDAGNITPEQFQKKANQFIQALKKSEYMSNFYFQFQKKKETMSIDSQSFQCVQEGEFVKCISFKGKDNFSSFEAEGYFLCRNGHPFVWFLKFYEPYEYAVQLGMKKMVIYQSLHSSEQAWTGCWYDDEKGQQIQRIKGKWTLIMKVFGLSNRLEEITPSNQLY